MRISDWSSDVCSSDLSVRFVLVTALREAGYRVDDFGNAADALAALAERGAPALLFTDVRMPGDDGLVLLDKLQAKDRKSVVSGKVVSVRVGLGGRRIIKKTELTTPPEHM